MDCYKSLELIINKNGILILKYPFLVHSMLADYIKSDYIEKRKLDIIDLLLNDETVQKKLYSKNKIIKIDSLSLFKNNTNNYSIEEIKVAVETLGLKADLSAFKNKPETVDKSKQIKNKDNQNYKVVKEKHKKCNFEKILKKTLHILKIFFKYAYKVLKIIFNILWKIGGYILYFLLIILGIILEVVNWILDLIFDDD